MPVRVRLKGICVGEWLLQYAAPNCPETVPGLVGSGFDSLTAYREPYAEFVVLRDGNDPPPDLTSVTRWALERLPAQIPGWDLISRHPAVFQIEFEGRR